MNKKADYFYLVFYNSLALLLWTIFALVNSINVFKPNTNSLFLLNFAQGIAFLEILHSILKIIPSSIYVTAPQIFSRLFILVLLNYFYINNEFNILTYTGFFIVSIAWSITEIIRYTHYLLSLLNKTNNTITYLRYSTFILLYPIGIIGEWCILLTPFYPWKAVLNLYTILVLITLLLYIVFFPKLYGHLWKQRNQKLN